MRAMGVETVLREIKLLCALRHNEGCLAKDDRLYLADAIQTITSSAETRRHTYLNSGPYAHKNGLSPKSVGWDKGRGVAMLIPIDGDV